MIVVIDYSVGNVKSVCNAFEHIGQSVRLSNDPKVIAAADGVVLPGVAAFGYAVKELGETAKIVRETALSGTPTMGICVGHQLLFDTSEEHGFHQGLGLVKGNVLAIPPGRVIPHMGWNMVKLPADMELFEGLGGQRHFYFAHSYYAKVTDSGVKAAFTEYDGVDLTASVQKNNIYGVQFHPEKSGNYGLAVLKNFAEICRRSR